MASPMSMFQLKMNLVSSPRGQNDNVSLNCSDFSIFLSSTFFLYNLDWQIQLFLVFLRARSLDRLV